MVSLRSACLSLAVIAAGGFAADRPAFAGNLVGNPGFETGTLDPWQGFNTDNGEAWNVTTVNPHSGHYAATCTGNQQIVQTFAPIATDDITSITFYEQQDSASLSFFQLDFSDGSNNFALLFPGTTYTLEDVTSVLLPGKFLTGFELYGNTGTRTYLDDVSIVTAPVPEASSLVSLALMVALGGVTVATARRKKTTHP